MGAVSIAEFEAALDTHGPDLSRWPDALRMDADALLAASGEARQLLEAARAVEIALRSPSPRAPQGLADRIVGRALGKRDPD